MKRLIALIGATVLLLSILSGCGQSSSGNSGSAANTDTASAESPAADDAGDTGDTEAPAISGTIVVGATPTPHAEVLEVVRPLLEAQGYELVIREFTDYVQPNLTLDSGDLDANYFQHLPYLENFNEENGTDLVSIAAIHYEPIGIFPGKTETLEDLADGAQIAVPNDTTNEARALLLLEEHGLITLNPDAGLEATINDIVDNPKGLRIIEIEAAQLARSLQDVDIAVINGNYAIQAGLNAEVDALAKEERDSLAAVEFANIIAVRAGDENREDLQALIAALQSPEVSAFIEMTYEGAVVAMF